MNGFKVYILEFEVPNVIYPDFDNFEVKNETDEWHKLFQFRLDECKLEDFVDQVKKWLILKINDHEFSVLNFNTIETNLLHQTVLCVLMGKLRYAQYVTYFMFLELLRIKMI